VGGFVATITPPRLDWYEDYKKYIKYFEETKEISEIPESDRGNFQLAYDYLKGDKTKWGFYADYGPGMALDINLNEHFVKKQEIASAFYGSPTPTMTDKEAILRKIDG
jgi:hypothetical protein